MPTLILAESSLEIIPTELRNHPSVISYCRRNEKKSSETLLDNSWHFAAMKGIKNEIKRGRPDLVHFSILEATTIPLYLQNKLNIFVHTVDDKVIRFGKNVHLPKSYHRFEGVIEKLYQEKKIMAKNELLLEIKEQTFSELIDEINPSKIFGFSTEGQLSSYEKIAAQISDNSCIIIGGFQKGHFSDSIQNKITDLYSIGNESFESHVITSRILYEYEKTIFM